MRFIGESIVLSTERSKVMKFGLVFLIVGLIMGFFAGLNFPRKGELNDNKDKK